jgi:hypothetical protein
VAVKKHDPKSTARSGCSGITIERIAESDFKNSFLRSNIARKKISLE